MSYPMFPPRVTLADLPPTSARNATPCMGGCGRHMQDRSIVCNTCWAQLDNLMRGLVRRYRKMPRENQLAAAATIEAWCARERSRPR